MVSDFFKEAHMMQTVSKNIDHAPITINRVHSCPFRPIRVHSGPFMPIGTSITPNQAYSSSSMLNYGWSWAVTLGNSFYSIITLCVRLCSVVHSTKRYVAVWYEESSALWKKIPKGNKTLADCIEKADDSMEPVLPEELKNAEALAEAVDTQKKELVAKFRTMSAIVQKMWASVWIQRTGVAIVALSGVAVQTCCRPSVDFFRSRRTCVIGSGPGVGWHCETQGHTETYS